MDEKEKNTSKEPKFKEIARFPLDFDVLEKHKDENGLPLLGMVGLYSVIGVADAIKEYGKPICPIDNLYANFGTVQRIRELIKSNWEHYNVTIEKDFAPGWKPNKGHHKRNFPL